MLKLILNFKCYWILFIALTYGDAYLIGQKRLAEFVNKKIKINVKHIETFKKFLALLQSVSESSAKGDYYYNKIDKYHDTIIFLLV